jgi:hypothetical protein
MDRRQFLINATIGGVTVPLLITEIGCSDDDNGGPGPGTGTETFTSSNSQGHTHTITIADSDLTAGGAHSYNSSNVSGHTHTVDLDAAQIDNLSLGCRVSEVSSNTSGHTHTWQILFAGFVADIPVTNVSDPTAHTHQITVPAEDLTSPSPADRDLTTTLGGTPGHTHSVTLTSIDYAALQNCLPVTKTSSETDFHTHDFMIQRA